MDKLTIEYLEGLVKEEAYIMLGKKTTICLLILKNGFEIIGVSGVVKAENFDYEIGKKVARQKAIDQMWLIEGYLLQQRIFEK